MNGCILEAGRTLTDIPVGVPPAETVVRAPGLRIHAFDRPPRQRQ